MRGATLPAGDGQAHGDHALHPASAHHASVCPMKHGVIIAALPRELHALVRGWPHSRREGAELWQRPAAAGSAWKWTAACAGMGAAAALRALAAAEAAGGPASRIISAGFAGALTDECLPGRIYCPAAVLQQATRTRIAVSDEISSAFTESEADADTQAARVGFHPDLVLVSVNQISSGPKKPALAWLYQAQLVDMEAAPLAQAARERGIPFGCLKGVSDGPHDRLPNHPSLISQNGRLRYGRFIVYALLRPRLWPSLKRIAQNSAEAARGLKSALQAVMDDMS